MQRMGKEYLLKEEMDPILNIWKCKSQLFDIVANSILR